MSAADRRAHWRDLVERRLPGAARPGWPVRLDHCFARILLDHACGGAWRDHVRPPAHATMPLAQLELAIALGEAVLAGRADLALLNRRSLAWRGKIALAPVPAALRDGDLTLRRWRSEDAAPFAALNADPAVMAHFPRTRTATESEAEAGLLDRRFVADGFGPWALERAGRFVGFAGAMRILRPCPSRAVTGPVRRSSWPGASRGIPGAWGSPRAPRGSPAPTSPGAAGSGTSWPSRRPATAAPAP